MIRPKKISYHVLRMKFLQKRILKWFRLSRSFVTRALAKREDTTKAQIRDYIFQAFEAGLKAISLYRDKSKDIQILENEASASTFPSRRPAEVIEIQGPRTCYLTISKINNQVREVFINQVREVFISTGKGGSALNAAGEALGRILSVGLRSDSSLLPAFAKALRNIDSGDIYLLGKRRYKSLFDAIGDILESSTGQPHEENNPGDICPNCGKFSLKREGGCRTCILCGYSTC